jgi:hydrogenase nickel incorporation protein HypB
MCDTCGCGDPKVVPIEVQHHLLAANDAAADHLRGHFEEHGVLAVNLMGSPGSGKTAVLEATARRLGGTWRLAAMSGDLATDRDGERLRAAGVPSLTVTTGQACHLDANLVHDALDRLPWHDADVVFIENVGNLVCPAVYDLGQAVNVVALSVTEGDDKPLKYPVMFRKADLVLVTKTDLLPHLDVDAGAIDRALDRVMPTPAVFHVSAHTGDGLGRWFGWLEAQLKARGGPDANHPAHDHQHR